LKTVRIIAIPGYNCTPHAADADRPPYPSRPAGPCGGWVQRGI